MPFLLARIYTSGCSSNKIAQIVVIGLFPFIVSGCLNQNLAVAPVEPIPFWTMEYTVRAGRSDRAALTYGWRFTTTPKERADTFLGDEDRERAHLVLQSVLEHTYADFDVIVVKNYSDDHTLDVVAGFNDSRVKAIDFANQGVIGAGRNRGIQETDGHYVAFLDSDDTWFPEKLEVVHRAIQDDPESGVFCHDQELIWEGQSGGRSLYGPPDDYKGRLHDYLLLVSNCLSTSATVVARRYLDELEAVRPKMLVAARAAHAKAVRDGVFVHLDGEAFGNCPNESVDYAVMEEAKQTAMVTLHAGWSDIGSWSALHEATALDEQGNAVRGDAVSYTHLPLPTNREV